MATARGGLQTWFTNTNRLDMRTLAVETLNDGRILVGFGGAVGADTVIYAGTVNAANGQLGGLATEVIARTPTGAPASTLRVLEIDAVGTGGAVFSFHSFNSSLGGPDSNFSLGTQIFSGGAFQGDPVPVNPGAASQDTDDQFSTVTLGNGRSLVFFTEPGTTGGFVNFTDGIRMATFGPNGRIIGSATTVIADLVVFPAAQIEADPREPAAALLKNGNVGLFWMQSNSVGWKELYFQQLTPEGTTFSTALRLSMNGLEPLLAALPDGGAVANWWESGSFRAQILGADGAPQGSSFVVSGTGLTPTAGFKMEVLNGGNIATAWIDPTFGTVMGQIVDTTGRVLSNPFPLLPSAESYQLTGLQFGLTAQGNTLVAWMNGTKIDGVPGLTATVMEAQSYDGRGSLGSELVGPSAGGALNGTARDDLLRAGRGDTVLDGRAGHDILTGGAGADRLFGQDGYDQLFGGGGADRLVGGTGGDKLSGGDKADNLSGGKGNDLLNGGLGRDVLTGGSGADRFVFEFPAEGRDKITDFNAAEGDRLALQVANFGPWSLQTGATTNESAFGLFFNTTTHVLSYDADGAGAFQRVEIALLQGVDQLTSAQLLMI